MGVGAERHDLMSQETHAAKWISFRQPVLRVAEASGRARRSSWTYEANPGEVWEEDEFWIELSWRIDPGRLARHPQVLRVALPAGRENHHRRVLPVDLRELRAGAARGGGEARLSPLEYMRSARGVSGGGESLRGLTAPSELGAAQLEGSEVAR